MRRASPPTQRAIAAAAAAATALSVAAAAASSRISLYCFGGGCHDHSVEAGTTEKEYRGGILCIFKGAQNPETSTTRSSAVLPVLPAIASPEICVCVRASAPLHGPPYF